MIRPKMVKVAAIARRQRQTFLGKVEWQQDLVLFFTLAGIFNFEVVPGVIWLPSADIFGNDSLDKSTSY